MSDPLDQLRGALSEHYQIERQIGQGGMATVYLALDVKHDRQVAVKVLRPELAASLGADRFLREIKTAARLQHPNILALYDSGAADGFLYYVMPYVEGESLRGRLDREHQLSLADAVHLTCEVAEALQCAHDSGVVHRDIKPENILIQQGHALVADFGIARAVSTAKGEKLTETGMAVGTPYYMSPEQSLGGEHLDGRSDEYALGCVLYEMLIGQPPFQGPNSMAILARHAMEAVPSLRIVRGSVPDELEDAVMRSLEKTPADRFATVREFGEALLAVDLGPAGRRTSTRGVTAIRRPGTRATPAVQPITTGTLGRLVRGSPARVWGLSIAALALLGVGYGTWQRRSHASVATAAAADSSSASALDPRRIAVLYFDSRAGNDSLGYLADGLTEALIHELSTVRPLQVISRNGVNPYRQTKLTPDSVGRALKVGTLVQGSVAESADRYRVRVSLVNAATGAEIGGTTVERPHEEIFALQDDLAKEVAEFLRKRLGQEIEVREQRQTQSAAAWETLQRAEQELRDVDPLMANGDTAAANRQIARADSLLARAETLDPKWAVPATQRGWLAYRRARMGGSTEKSSNAELTALGLKHAARALAIRADDPDGLELRGTLNYWRWLLNLEPEPAAADKLLSDAQRDLRAAVAANPSQASAWNSLSHLLINESQTAEAKLAAMRAYESDPYLVNVNRTLQRLFATSADLDDPLEAKHWCEEGRRRFPEDPEFVECQLWLASMRGQKPDVAKAWQLLSEYVRLKPAEERAYEQLRGQMIVAAVIARDAALTKRPQLRDSARSVIERSRADGATDPTRELALWEAIARTLLGDKDEAFKQLSVYFATNPQQRDGLAKEQTWYFEDLRKDPRWATLVGSTR